MGLMRQLESVPQGLHGGPDALGVPLHDFSTNSNACGPCPQAVVALQACDASHYPDPHYTALRQQLAGFHQVDASRIVLAASASEFIFRITAWVAQQGGSRVSLPPHAYGDYAQAAQAWGLDTTARPDEADLVWACEPSSPLGAAQSEWPHDLCRAAPVVLDCAYAPLRLSGAPTLSPAQLQCVWQLWTPNKALGLTGVRAAYVIAPLGAHACVVDLNRLCPSWPLGAHGVALLQAWVQPEVQAWLAQSLLTLRGWKARKISLLQGLGWTTQPSDANFFCARATAPLDWQALRAAGIKLRDAASFGLPGQVRLGVLGPEAQDVLVRVLRQIDLIPSQCRRSSVDRLKRPVNDAIVSTLK